MSVETDVLLRTLLYQSLITNDIEEIRRAIEVMCSKDVIASVKEKADEHKASSKN